MSSTDKRVKITIDPICCKKCGLCQAFCPQEVYTSAKDMAPLVTYPEKCTYCRLCDLRCPDFAITLEVLT